MAAVSAGEVSAGEVTAAWLSLGPGGRPGFTDVLLVTELLHDAAAAQLGRERPRRADSRLLGVHADGRPMSGHRHAHFFGLADAQGRVGEVLVWTPGGLAADEVTALSRIDVLRRHAPGRPVADIPVRLTGLGGEEMLPEALTGPARRWRCLTPYVPTGHPKGEAASFAARRLPRDAGKVAQLAHLDGSCIQWREVGGACGGNFERRRSADRRAGRFVPPAMFLEFTFGQEVTGPLCLGALTHLGLGLLAVAP